VLALACTTRDGSPGCGSNVLSVTVPGATTLVPSRSLALEIGLPTVVDRLNAARSSHRATLSRARTGASQALAARRLAADHRAAAHTLPAVGGPAAAPLTRALGNVAAAYDALSRAAQEASPARFASALAGIRRTEAVLAGGVAEVSRPATAPPPYARSATPVPHSQDGPESGGPPVIVFVLLIALAAAAGAATGTTGAASRVVTRARRFGLNH
jgi:hypothetical protein